MTRLIREAREKYEDNIARKGKQDPSQVHKYVRSQLKVKPLVGALKTETGQLTDSEGEAAEVLNAYFQSVFVTESTDNMPVFHDMVDDSLALTDFEITESNVLAQLQNLIEGKAAGPDGLPTTVLKRCANQLTKPLTTLFKRSLQAREVAQPVEKS